MLNGRRLLNGLLILLLVVAAGTSLAYARSPLGIGTAEPGFQTMGSFGAVFAWVNAQQQSFYRALTGALKDMRDNPWHLTTLIDLSFAYGVFHAAGPGHGKAVISSYMITNETELKRGVLISFISAFMQGIVAVLLVGAAYLVLRGTAISMKDATQVLEIASFALIALFGGWLMFRKIRALVRTAPSVATMEFASAGGHGAQVRGHDHHHHHGPGEVYESCGHAHAPEPAMLRAEEFSLREAWSAIVTVGLRPCSGALLVMSFSLLNGLYLGGVLSVAAMSVGTAITVSALATLAVTAKDIAVRYAGRGSTAAMRVANTIEILGAALVLLLGLLLLGAALQA